MSVLYFTILFKYEIAPGSVCVDLCADIEMIDNSSCIVRNIRRQHFAESPLLPPMRFVKPGKYWLYDDGLKESNLSRAIGERIDQHLEQYSQKNSDETIS